MIVATLLRLVGIDLKYLARKTAITIVLAMLGTFAAMLAFALCFAALYLWLELKLGTFAALGILGGTSALLAGVLFAVAFLRASPKPRARAEDALRAAADPVTASTAAIARAADEAVNGAADIVHNGSRQQIAGCAYRKPPATMISVIAVGIPCSRAGIPCSAKIIPCSV